MEILNNLNNLPTTRNVPTEHPTIRFAVYSTNAVTEKGSRSLVSVDRKTLTRSGQKPNTNVERRQ